MVVIELVLYVFISSTYFSLSLDTAMLQYGGMMKAS